MPPSQVLASRQCSASSHSRPSLDGGGKESCLKWGLDTLHARCCLGPRTKLPVLKPAPGIQFRIFKTKSGLPWLVIRVNAPKLFRGNNFEPCAPSQLEEVLQIIVAEVRRQIPDMKRDWLNTALISRIDLAAQTRLPATSDDLNLIEQAITLESLRQPKRHAKGVYTHDFRGKRPSSVSGIAYLKENPENQEQHLRIEARYRRSALRYRYQREATLLHVDDIVGRLEAEATEFWSRRLRWCRAVPDSMQRPATDLQECLADCLTSFLEVGLDAFGPRALHTTDDLLWMKRMLKKRDSGILMSVHRCSPALADVRDALIQASDALKMKRSLVSRPSREQEQGLPTGPRLLVDVHRRSPALLLSLLLSRNQSLAFGSDLNLKSGGPCRARTYDPLIKSQLLCQLS